jgi:hypothetical protein
MSAGLRSKIRNEVYLSMLLAIWGSGLVTLVLIEFIEPMVMVGSASINDAASTQQLISIFEIAAMQLPIVIPQLMLVKLSAASKMSWKVMLTYTIGLATNLVLGYMWVSNWGVIGIASAWLVATLVTTLIIMLGTRPQSLLGWGECLCIIAGWLVIAAFALAVYLKSFPIAAGVVVIFFLLIFAQIKSLIKRDNLPALQCS